MPDKQRLLVVDDSTDITNLIGEIAETEGFDVHTLNDSTIFFKEFDSLSPDLVCIDIHMPDVDGIEILRWLASRGSKVGVVILSGGDPLFTKVAERIGEASKLQVKTLEKPFRIDQLRAALDNVSPHPEARMA
jgi:DNA-binding response OmpR family regulator